jgi:hypothetical protein
MILFVSTLHHLETLDDHARHDADESWLTPQGTRGASHHVSHVTCGPAPS